MRRTSTTVLALLVTALGCRDEVTGPRSKYLFEALSPISIEAVVGTVLPNGATVIVKDHAGRPVGNVTVLFRFHEASSESVVLVRSLEVATNNEGIASAGEWTLGHIAGNHLIQATIFGAPQLWFTIKALADVPAALQLIDDDYAEIGLPGLEVQPPRVQVADRFGNNVAGVRVTFAITAGGGSLEGAEAVTDAGGAAPTSWTLGPSPGVNSVTAQALDLPSIELSVEAVEPSAIYDLTMINGDAIEEWGVESAFIALMPDGRFVSYMTFYFDDTLWVEAESGTYLLEGSRMVLTYRSPNREPEAGSLDSGMLRFDRYDDHGGSRTWEYTIRN